MRSRKSQGLKIVRNAHCCMRNEKFRLLKVDEVMALQTTGDLIFTLKVLSAAFEIAMDNCDDAGFRAAVLDECEQNIRQGHLLFVRD